MTLRPLSFSLAAAALFAGGILFATTSFASRAAPTQGDKKPAPAKQEPQGGMPEMDGAMMERMMALATPGPAHKRFASQVGTAQVTYRMRMAPDAPWMDTPGTIESKTVLGGRYLMQTHTFEMMGMKMEGLTFMGFDNESQEYISLWMDSMSTWWVTSRGKADAAGVVTMTGEMKDVAGKRPFRMKMTPKDDGSTDFEMYDTIGGKEVQVMSYTSKFGK